MRSEKQKHIVLVHGLWHGGWCWYKLVSLLKMAGYCVTAVDLGASGINPKQLNQLQSFWDYLQPLMEFMASLPPTQTVILVGHSYGGLGISLAMEKFPEKISLGLFLSAYMPQPDVPLGSLVQEYLGRKTRDSLLDIQIEYERGEQRPPTSSSLGPVFMETVMYSNCPKEELELAKLLVRPSGFFIEEMMGKDFMVTQTRYGWVNRVYVVCQEDPVMDEEFQKLMIHRNPPQEVKSIRTDHMVMFSNPQLLFQCLQKVAHRYS